LLRNVSAVGIKRVDVHKDALLDQYLILIGQLCGLHPVARADWPTG
jgi:hypothetical protein